MAADLNEVLQRLYEAGAEDVPADEVDWEEGMTPALMQALHMGYIRYRDRGEVRHFYLTKFGFDALGIEPPKFSPLRIIMDWIRRR